MCEGGPFRGADLTDYSQVGGLGGVEAEFDGVLFDLGLGEEGV